MVNIIVVYRSEILAWYDSRISTAKVEGINNKIRVMKRKTSRFRDDKYFELKLLMLYRNITANFGLALKIYLRRCFRIVVCEFKAFF